MATVTNSDGSTSEFKIGQDDEATVSVKLNKDGTVRKKRGPAKKYTFDRKVLGAAIALNDYNELLSQFGSCTNAVTELVKLWRQTKGQKQ